MFNSMSLFVGRKKEINEALVIIRDKAILNIFGVGGIGKSCLLNELIQQARQKNDIFIVGPFDFGEIENQSRIGFLINIAEQIDKAKFSNFLNEISTYYAIDSTERLGYWTRIFETFMQCYHEVYSSKQKVLVFDTFELIEERDLGQWIINEFIPHLINSTSFIISGRSKLININSIKTTYLELNTLSKNECLDYFNNLFSQHGLGAISQSELDTLFSLSEGIPINLAIAANWYIESNRKLNPKWTKESFNFSAVAWIRNLDNPQESIILLAMAAFNVRFNPYLVSELLSIDVEQAQNLLKGLARFSFTKVNNRGSVFGLHDEMRNLIQTHITLPVDTMVALANKAFHYFENQLSLTNSEFKDDLIAKSIYFLLIANPDSGRKKFEQQFNNYLLSNKIDQARLLLTISEGLLVTGFPHEKNRTDLAYAQILVAEWHSQQAQEILERIEQIESVESNIKLKILFLITKARALILSAKPLLALEVLNKALKINNGLSDKPFSADIYNLLGSTCQSIGQYDKALMYQENAIQIAQYSRDKGAITIALQHQAETFRRLGRVGEAIEYTEQSFLIANKMADENIEFQALLTKAKVLRDEWQFDTAEKIFLDLLHHLKIGHISRPWSASIYNEMAWLYFLKKDLNLAEKYAQESLSFCKSFHFISEQPSALHTLLHIEMEKGNYSESEVLISKCYDIAKNVVDYFFVFNALEHKAEIAYIKRIYEKLYEYEGEMNKYKKQGYFFPLFNGRLKIRIGDILFENQEKNKALKYYLQGFVLVAEAGITSSPKRIEADFDRIDKRFDELNIDETKKWVSRFKKTWTQKGFDVKFPRLISICNLALIKKEIND